MWLFSVPVPELGPHFVHASLLTAVPLLLSPSPALLRWDGCGSS